MTKLKSLVQFKVIEELVEEYTNLVSELESLRRVKEEIVKITINLTHDSIDTSARREDIIVAITHRCQDVVRRLHDHGVCL